MLSWTALVCLWLWTVKGGSGSYLYVNSGVQREGDVARVTTLQEFPASVGVCHLRFWFCMHGSKLMGTLKVRWRKYKCVVYNEGYILNTIFLRLRGKRSKPHFVIISFLFK